MAKISIELPNQLPFFTDITVQIGQINHAQHLDSALLTSMVQEARFRYLRTLGGALDMVQGAKLVVREELVIYRSEAFYGDIIRVEMGLVEAVGSTIVFGWRMLKVPNLSGREVARGVVDTECIDPETSEAMPIPKLLMDLVIGADVPRS